MLLHALLMLLVALSSRPLVTTTLLVASSASDFIGRNYGRKLPDSSLGFVYPMKKNFRSELSLVSMTCCSHCTEKRLLHSFIHSQARFTVVLVSASWYSTFSMRYVHALCLDVCGYGRHIAVPVHCSRLWFFSWTVLLSKDFLLFASFWNLYLSHRGLWRMSPRSYRNEGLKPRPCRMHTSTFTITST